MGPSMGGPSSHRDREALGQAPGAVSSHRRCCRIGIQATPEGQSDVAMMHDRVDQVVDDRGAKDVAVMSGEGANLGQQLLRRSRRGPPRAQVCDRAVHVAAGPSDRDDHGG